MKTFHYETSERDFLTRISFSNDEPDYLISGYNAAGQPLVVANEDATITYGYDPAGRRILERQELLGLSGSHDFTYSYNQDGQLAGHVRPDGSLIDYNYNDRQLLSALTVDSPPPVAEYFYNGRNQLTAIQLEEGLTSQLRAYDRGGRLVSVVQEVHGSFPDGSLYNLDPVGQRIGISRLSNLGGTGESYGYDTARQVVSAFYGSGSPEAWTYDAAGNRISDFSNNTATDYTVNAVNQYTAIQGAGPNAVREHDLKGNLLDNGEGSIYTWDINNRLQTVVKDNGQSASYGYDAFGRRVWKREQINGTTETTWFLTNGWNVELEHDGSDYVRRYSWGQDLSGSLQGAGGVGGLVMIEHLNGSAAPETYFPSYDGNGNVTALIDNSGEVAATYRYNAYGGLIGWTGAIEKSRYRFSTKPVEEVSGLYYYGYRYYDPKTGRWPSRDPIQELGGINLYGMVSNSPVNWIDVLGLEKCCVDGEEVEKEKDDFGRECCPDKMGEVEYEYRRPTPFVDAGHAQISTPNQDAGLYPGLGGARTGRVIPTLRSLPRRVVFNACPESVSEIDRLIDEDEADPPSWLGEGGCSMWAMCLLEEAGNDRVFPSNTPGGALGSWASFGQGSVPNN